MHEFISHVSCKLNKLMNHYRKINDVDKKEQIEAMAPKLVQDIYKLFWFRVNVQEPTIEAHFFMRDTEIDLDTMKGRWNDGEIEEIDHLCVDICYFPLIGRPNEKIYTAAKVFPREKIDGLSEEENDESKENEENNEDEEYNENYENYENDETGEE